MKITVGTFILSDHNSAAPAADLRINGRRLVQIAELVRATAVKLFDRKNRQTTITFTVARKHASIRESSVYMLEHATKVPSQGLVTLEARDTNGGLTRRYLKDAVVTTVDSQQMGVSTFHSYEIVGGEVLTQKPT